MRKPSEGQSQSTGVNAKTSQTVATVRRPHCPPATPTTQQHAIDSTALAWVAGFADADGCITAVWQRYNHKGAKPRKPTPRLKLVFTQNDWATLDRVQKILGIQGHLNQAPYNASQNRPMFHLQYDGRHALAAIRILHPFLYRKRRHADLAAEFWEKGRLGQRPGLNGFPPDIWRLREKYIQRFRKLN